ISGYIFYYFEERNSAAVKETEGKIEIATAHEKLPYRLKIFYYLEKEMGTYVFVKDLGNREKVIEVLTDDRIAADVFEFINGWGNIDISENQFIKNIEQDEKAKNSEMYLEQEIKPLEEELEKLNSSSWNWRKND